MPRGENLNSRNSHEPALPIFYYKTKNPSTIKIFTNLLSTKKAMTQGWASPLSGKPFFC